MIAACQVAQSPCRKCPPRRRGQHIAEEPPPKFGPELGYQKRELFEAFLKLPARQRRMIRDIIVAFTKAAEK